MSLNYKKKTNLAFNATNKPKINVIKRYIFIHLEGRVRFKIRRSRDISNKFMNRQSKKFENPCLTGKHIFFFDPNKIVISQVSHLAENEFVICIYYSSSKTP